MASWSEFEKRRQSSDEKQSDNHAEEFSDVCARLLITADGKEFLKHLYALYIDRRNPAGCTDAALRETEAQRRLVHDLEKARDLGLERAMDKKKTA